MGDPIWITQPDRSASFRGCACIRDSWPTITALAIQRGLIKRNIRVTQGCYSGGLVAKSGATHNGGGVLDIEALGRAMDDLLEECGIAAYERDKRDNMVPHSHIIWIGCPHLDASAARQVTSWRNRRNALASNLPDRDKTRPNPIRTWSQGLAWAKAQLEDEMTPEQEKRIIDAVKSQNPWAATFGKSNDTAGSRLARVLTASEAAAAQTRDISRGDGQISLRQEVADAKTLLISLSGELAGLRTAIGQIATGKIDLPAIEAAAKKGAESALAGARVTVNLGDGSAAL